MRQEWATNRTKTRTSDSKDRLEVILITLLPFNEFLKDLAPQTVTDLHNVGLAETQIWEKSKHH